MKNLVRMVRTNKKTLQIQHSMKERFAMHVEKSIQSRNITLSKLLLWRQKFDILFPISYISKLHMTNSDKIVAAGPRNLYLSVWMFIVNYMRQPT